MNARGCVNTLVFPSSVNWLVLGWVFVRPESSRPLPLLHSMGVEFLFVCITEMSD